jgi:hypothetical protein
MPAADLESRLAYVFWHRPARDVSRGDYERAQAEFHARLEWPSATFRRDRLPFIEKDGYEDWYLVEGWADLGALNAVAVDANHRAAHDAAAAGLAAGWGGIFALVRGAFEIPASPRWLDKPRGEATDDFLAGLDAPLIWRRQLVLGPAPEFCVAG